MISHMRRWLWRLRGFVFLAPAVTCLVTVCVVVFLIQQTAARVELIQVYGYRCTYAQALVPCFSLNWPLLAHGFVWQLVTYMFLHANAVHLSLNMLTVLLFGSALENEVGGRRFWMIFLAGGVLGGLGWLAVTALMPYVPSIRFLADWVPPVVRAWLPASDGAQTLDTAMCMGASGGVFALIGAYAALFPRRHVFLLLFFVIPVKFQARSLAWVLGALTVAEAVFLQFQVAYSAHLAGGVAGFVCGLRMRRMGLFGCEE